MTPLAWFRFRVSGKVFIRYQVSVFLALSVLFAIGHADDWDGNGYDDATGEWVGYGGGGGYTDSDGDGLYDSDEMSVYYTGPYTWDTDGDGQSDGSEVSSGFNPIDPYSNSSGGGSPPDTSTDSDGDGLTNYLELTLHLTDPNLFDTDGDGIGDWQEMQGYEAWYSYDVFSYTSYTYNSETGAYESFDVYYPYSYSVMIYTDPRRADTDYDLLPDGYEKNQGLDPSISSDGHADTDGDDLSRGEEFVIGTNYALADTDGDGINDGAEVLQGTNPLDSNDPGEPEPDPDPNPNPNPDPGPQLGFVPGLLNIGDGDSDGLPDSWEFQHFGGKYRYSANTDPDGDSLDNGGEYLAGTHPLKADTDADGLNDGAEVTLGSNPLDSDSDDDKYEDGWEYNNGLNPTNASDITTDTDGNGIPDAYELFHFVASGPVSQTVDGDADGLTLGFEIPSLDQDGNPVPGSGFGYYAADFYNATFQFVPLSQGEFTYRTYPDRSDSDGDGVSDANEVLPFFVNSESWDYTTQTYVTTQITVFSNPRIPDTDNDGFKDGEERTAGTDPTNPWSFPTVDYTTDTDEDGLSDYDESYWGTNPALANTDGDTYTDFEEVYYYGTDPIDSTDFWLDTDGDGISDSDETNLYGTNPGLADSDGDGVQDGIEIFTHSTDPLDSTHVWTDADGDGLRDDVEILLSLSVTSSDTDGDGLSDAWEFYNGTDPALADTLDADNDQMLDAWELVNHLDPADPSDAFDDPDEDGLNNRAEFQHQTSPWSKDSDGDWLRDDLEVRIYGTDPQNWDTDGDGSADGLELFWYGTNPLDPSDFVIDTDGDWIPDAWEIANGMDPSDAEDIYVDDDGDGLVNGSEYWLGGDPQLADTDGDGIDDRTQWENGDPISANGSYLNHVEGNSGGHDFDGDGLSDSWEVDHGLDLFDASDALIDSDGDGLDSVEEFTRGTDPENPDSDGDGLSDGDETDIHQTNPILSDTDGDGLSDAIELANPGLDPNDSSDGLSDADADGLSRAREFLLGTSPDDADTDDDLLDDGWEIRHGTNPLVADDHTQFDADEDGLPGSWELQHGLDPLDASDKLADPDGDGLSNLDEYVAGTDPTVADTDGDGLSDAIEVNGFYMITGTSWGLYYTNPLTVDSDGDGISDGTEFTAKTPPTAASYSGGLFADESGLEDLNENDLPDAWEVSHGAQYVPGMYGQSVLMTPFYSPWDDFDNDGLSNFEEYSRGTDPTMPDSDGDGLSDGNEAFIGFTAAVTVTSTNTTEMQQWDEATQSYITVFYENPYTVTEYHTHYTDPTKADTDDDGLKDGDELLLGLNAIDPSDGLADVDADGLSFAMEYYLGTLPNNSDTDGDLLPDGWEVAHGFDPLDPNDGLLDDEDNDGVTNGNAFASGGAGAVFGSGSAQWRGGTTTRDTDGDGISDHAELQSGTNPFNSNDAPQPPPPPCNPTGGNGDSDGDGISDKAELQNGTSPFDPRDPPPPLGTP